MAEPQIFHCTSLNAGDYDEAGLHDVSNISVQPNGVCEAAYHDRQITISAIASDQIPMIKFTSEYQNNLLSHGTYDVVKVDSGRDDAESSSCMELIIGGEQIIAVSADTCEVTAKVVYEIIDHKL